MHAARARTHTHTHITPLVFRGPCSLPAHSLHTHHVTNLVGSYNVGKLRAEGGVMPSPAVRFPMARRTLPSDEVCALFLCIHTYTHTHTHTYLTAHTCLFLFWWASRRR
jgi:hypothetical protein